jgi:hypothetical protein
LIGELRVVTSGCEDQFSSELIARTWTARLVDLFAVSV